jgi:hypothetical protein
MSVRRIHGIIIEVGQREHTGEDGEGVLTGKKNTGEEMVVLDLERVNLFVLHKQHLSDDSRSESGDIVRIAADVGGLHATNAITPYLSLFARMEGFRKEMLEEELYVKRSLAKIRCVRGTVYIHTRQMIPIAFASNRRMNIPNSERFYRYMDRTEEEYAKLSRRILKLLSGRGMTAPEIKRNLGEEKSVSPVVNLMCDYGLLVRGAPAGGWRSNAHTYHLFEEYMPGVDLASVGEEEARQSMVRLYLAAFAPATDSDVAWWTALRIGDVRKMLESMGDAVSRVGIKGLDHDRFMLTEEVPVLAAMLALKSPLVDLLPALDPYLMAYKERDRYLANRFYSYIFDRSGNATSSILADGRIVGVWDYDGKPPTLKWFLFEKVSKRSLQAIMEQALRLGRFFAGGEVELRECEDMEPLSERTAGAFMAPLKER